MREFYQYHGGTAPTHHLYGLRAALDIIHEEGIEQAWQRHETLARAVWAGVRRGRRKAACGSTSKTAPCAAMLSPRCGCKRPMRPSCAIGSRAIWGSHWRLGMARRGACVARLALVYGPCEWPYDHGAARRDRRAFGAKDRPRAGALQAAAKVIGGACPARVR